MKETTTDDKKEENKAAEKKRSRKRSKLRPPKLYLFDILKKDTTTSAYDNSSLFGSQIKRKQEPAVSDDVVKRYEQEEGFLELRLGINGGYDPVMLFGVRISPSSNKDEQVSCKGVCMEKDKINTITKTIPSSSATADTLLSLPSSSADTLQALMVIDREAQAPLVVVGNNNNNNTLRVKAKRKEPKHSHTRKRQRLEAEQKYKNPTRDIVIYDQGNINNQSVSIAVQPDMFEFKKILEESDVNKLSRLLVRTGMAEHINAFLNEEQLQLVNSVKGLRVRILDLDEREVHELFYMYQSSMKSHIFKSNWANSFVRRRNLQAGDEIGMYFQDAKAMPPLLAFSVLRREKAGGI